MKLKGFREKTKQEDHVCYFEFEFSDFEKRGKNNNID